MHYQVNFPAAILGTQVFLVSSRLVCLWMYDLEILEG